MADNGQIIINYGKFEGHAEGIDNKNKDLK